MGAQQEKYFPFCRGIKVRNNVVLCPLGARLDRLDVVEWC